MNYKQKLKEWNNTEKYMQELDFLYGLISPKAGELVLDYGCGVMTAIENFNARDEANFYGYDVEEYGEPESFHLYDKEIKKKYNCIYFMHSLAHIKEPKITIDKLRDSLSEKGRLIVITPNLDWMDAGYNNDNTVVRHYTMHHLTELFISEGYRIKEVGQFGYVRGNINERIFIVAQK